jgi:hypothetical protein
MDAAGGALFSGLDDVLVGSALGIDDLDLLVAVVLEDLRVDQDALVAGGALRGLDPDRLPAFG